jgi:hypothetical protein
MCTEQKSVFIVHPAGVNLGDCELGDIAELCARNIPSNFGLVIVCFICTASQGEFWYIATVYCAILESS